MVIRRRVPHMGWLLLFVLANIAGAGFGVGLRLIPGTSIIFWLPSGIFLAALLLNRRETWVWWVAGAMVAELIGNVLWFKNPIAHAVLYFIANAAEATFGAWMIQTWVTKSDRSPRALLLESPKTSLHFVMLAGAVAPIIGATIIAAIDVISSKDDFWSTWQLVWLGNGAGVLVAAPLTIAAVQLWRKRRRVSAQKAAEFVFLAGFTVLVTWLALRQMLPTVYVALPPMLWAAVRFQVRGAWAILVAVLLTVAAFTRTGQGEFTGSPAEMYERMVALQVFLAVCACSSLIVAGLSSVHLQSVTRLKNLAATLERRISERTESLEQSERKLRLAIEATGVGIVDIDLASQRVVLDDRGRSILETDSACPVTIESILSSVHHEDREAVAEAFTGSPVKGGPHRLTLVARLQELEGPVRWISFAAQALFSPGNRTDVPVRLVGTVLDITDRKQVEADLLEKEELLRRTLEIAGVGLTRCNRDLVYLSANPTYGSVVGVAPSDIVGKHISEVKGAAALSAIQPYIDRVLKGERVEFISDVPMKHRGIRSIHAVYTPEHNSAGLVIGWVASVTDITEHKITAEQLRRADAERTLNRLAENTAVAAAEIISWAPALLYVYDLNARTSVFQNRPLVELLGYSAADGMPFGENEWHELMHPEDKDRFREYQKKLDSLAEGEFSTFEYRLKHTDGSWCWFHSRDVRVGSGHLVVGSASDITERKEAEQALQASEERFRLSLQGSKVIIAQTDPELRYVWIYDAHPHFPSDALVGKRDSELSDDPGLKRLEDLKRRVRDTGNEITEEIDIFVGDGVRTYEIHGEPRYDVEGTLHAIITIGVDITERKRMEADLEAALSLAETANLAKDRFLARLSHELRTPLTPVLFSVEGLMNNPILPPEIRESVAMIRRNVEMEISLIDDLLDLSRVISGKLRMTTEEVNIHSAVIQACETCASTFEEKEITVHHEFEGEGPMVLADPGRLQQVFLNIFRNAAKFTPAGGGVFVQVGTTSDNQVQISVRDTGSGFTSDFLPKIFDSFEQGANARELGGMGLGLAISKEIVELHGGSIEASSDGPGLGATFTVLLPQLMEEQRPSQEQTRPGEQSGTPPELCLLLVEDNLDTAAVLSELLSMSGNSVTTAHSVEMALEKARSVAFDVLVSDIGLPDASGYDLVRQLKSLYTFKAIAMSGYGMEEDIQRSREAGFDDHIVKPATVAQIDRAIRRVSVQTQ